MEFAQYYSYDQPALQFADLSYYSSEPPLPPPQQHQQQHRFEPVPTTDIDYQNNQRHEETGTAMQKDSEEADTSSRPRLTTEQTNILEENFQKESKPVTEVKRQLAARVGLPLDKVNNWYQNRRAKAKHLRKQEILEVMHVHQLNPPTWQDFGGGMISPAFSPNEYPSDLTTAMQMSIHDYPSYHVPSDAPQFTSLHQQQYFPWNGVLETDRTPQVSQSFLSSESVTEHKIQDNDGSHPPILAHSQSDASNSNSLTATTFSGWESNHTTPAIWTPNHPQENPFDNQHLIHQQSTASPLATDHSMANSTSSPESMPIYQTEILAPNPQHAPPPLLNQPNEQTFSQSPETSPFTSLPTQPPPGNFSRRGSDSSDLATTFNTFHLQKGQSQQNSDEDIFKTPPVPNSNLAARRKKNRPPPLGAAGMRSQSCTGPQNSSPITKTASIGQSPSVRRIKSTGNSLNVISNGRIQKSGAGPAQKSPLHFATFQESGAFENVGAITSQQPSSSQTPSNSQVGPLTPHTPSGIDAQSTFWNKSSMQVGSGPSSHEQPYSTATYGVHTQVTSPPHTPFIEVPGYVPQFPHYSAPPQSAPAHITSFQDISPPFQASLGEPYMYYQMSQMYQQPLSMMHLNQSQPNFFSYSGPQIMSDSPTMGGYSNFYANPVAPPPKEVEFVLQTFPQPKDAPPPPKEPHRPKQYVFQNAGPNDF